MPRKKAEGPTRTPKPTPTVPLVARYLVIAVAELQTLIVEGRETAANKLQLEIEDQLQFSFSGPALVTLRALVAWIRQRAEDFARENMVPPPSFGIGPDFIRDIAEEGGEVIEHE